MLTKDIWRRKDDHRGQTFCKAELRLDEVQGRFTICGVAGYITGRRQAQKMAEEYWESYFEDSPEQIWEMGERVGRRFRSPRTAARFVLASDGEFHGLDVVRDEEDEVWIGHSFGQIRDELAEYFPELEPWMRWHLNDMHAECKHQEARGQTYGTHPGATCPECGWALGHGWDRRELPANIRQLFSSDFWPEEPRVRLVPDAATEHDAPATLTSRAAGGQFKRG